jgi:hypothetical protein
MKKLNDDVACLDRHPRSTLLKGLSLRAIVDKLVLTADQSAVDHFEMYIHNMKIKIIDVVSRYHRDIASAVFATSTISLTS